MFLAMSDNEQKDIIKQAIKEWMDERYAEIGHWTIRILVTTALAGLFWAYVQARGFRFP